MTNLTPASQELFDRIVADAPDWAGTPLLDVLTPAERGNLTDLKVKGLISTQVDDDSPDCVWVYITDAGIAHSGRSAEDLGIWR